MDISAAAKTHRMNHMIPRCVRIRSSHLSCEHTEQQGNCQTGCMVSLTHLQNIGTSSTVPGMHQCRLQGSEVSHQKKNEPIGASIAQKLHNICDYLASSLVILLYPHLTPTSFIRVPNESQCKLAALIRNNKTRRQGQVSFHSRSFTSSFAIGGERKPATEQSCRRYHWVTALSSRRGNSS